MSLKQSIVIKNEFTHNGVNTPGKGSRGGTPGQYVLRYMARLEATETVTPVPESPQASVFDYAMRYMLREDATEELKSSGNPNASFYELDDKFQELDRLTGRSFGSQGITLSDQTVRESSQTIQDAFDEGHSVQKIILSFTEEYLRDNNVLAPDFKHKGRGSYRGQIDQLKMRQAITAGVDRMTSVGDYANPEWVGVIQVDTSHVHAHIALVDTEFSPSRMMDDGFDKGKLTQREMMNLRRGVQYELNEMKAIKGFHQQVSLERQNVMSYMKDYAHDHIGKNSRLQILIASLPEEQHMWRYGTNRKEMKYPNELAERLVLDLFEEQPDKSGYSRTMNAIDQYIQGRVDTEGIDENEQERLLRNGRKLLVERSVNGIYNSLKTFDKSKLNVQTPMLDVQSASEDELIDSLSDGFDQVGFELRVRGYGRRMSHHENESQGYRELTRSFDQTNEEVDIATDALILRQFYEEELQWHMALADKYRSFFGFNTREDRMYQQKHQNMYERLDERYGIIDKKDLYMSKVDDGSIYEELDGFESRDDVFKDSQTVDEYVLREYGVKQGSRAFSELHREGLDFEIAMEKADYMKDLKDYTYACFVDGVATQEDWSRLQPDHRMQDLSSYQEALMHPEEQFQTPNPPQVRSDGITDEHFDYVKALDIHHLGIDYYTQIDRSISEGNRETFVESMRWREYFLDGAESYLLDTGQDEQMNALESVHSDVTSMRETVDYLTQNNLIPIIDPITTDDEYERNTRTIRVDTGVDVLSSIDEELQASDWDLADELIDDIDDLETDEVFD